MVTHNRLHDHFLTHTTLVRTHFDCVEGNSWHIVTLEMLDGKYLKAFTMPLFGFQSFKKQLGSFLESNVGAFVQFPLPISKVLKTPFKQSASQLLHHKHQAL
jgi:hypothetical protein